jgi:integrase
MTYTVRWKVDAHTFQRTFDTAKLAESFRSRLVVGIRQAEPFEIATGLPVGEVAHAPATTWLQHAMAFVDVKWPHASPCHRKGIAEGLVTATMAMLPEGGPQPAQLRMALQAWTFNTAVRAASPDLVPDMYAVAIAWAERQSPAVVDIATAARLRPVLDALALKLDGTPASPSTVARTRSAVYSAFQYVVEIDELAVNPMDKVVWKPPPHTDVVDRQAVVNPRQARVLLGEVARIYPSLEAFFACIYYAAMRPAEVRHLKVLDLDLPDDEASWGTLHLLGSTQTAGAARSYTGEATEDRELKHRARRATRDVPAPPELVATLRRHLARFPSGASGRLFVTRAGRGGVPVAPEYASPQAMGIVYRVWDEARRHALTASEYGSPLAKRPYDLRHAAVSLWLNAGVPATQVAAWAGHSVHVLLRVYASCIVGQDEAARMRVESAFRGPSLSST